MDAAAVHGVTTTTASITMKTDRLNVSMSFIHSLLPPFSSYFLLLLSSSLLWLMERKRDDCVSSDRETIYSAIITTRKKKNKKKNKQNVRSSDMLSFDIGIVSKYIPAANPSSTISLYNKIAAMYRLYYYLLLWLLFYFDGTYTHT
jgi:flagellar biosynthesis component FlhA